MIPPSSSLPLTMASCSCGSAGPFFTIDPALLRVSKSYHLYYYIQTYFKYGDPDFIFSDCEVELGGGGPTEDNGRGLGLSRDDIEVVVIAGDDLLNYIISYNRRGIQLPILVEIF